MKKTLLALILLVTINLFAAVNIDFNYPSVGAQTLSEEYEYLRTNEVYSLKMDCSITASNKPTGTIAFDKTNYLLKQWNGSSWVDFGLNKLQAQTSAGLSLFEDGGAGIFVEDGGRVGIGTTSPATTLDVNGYVQGTRLYVKNGTDQHFWYGNSAGLRLYDAQNSVDRMTIAADGKVGIGTVSPATTLDVNGTSTLDAITAAGAFGLTGTFTQQGGAIVFNEGSGDYDFRVESDTSVAELFVDAGAGRVGINTAAPDEKLHVVGNIKLTGDLYTVGWTDYSASSTIVGWTTYTNKKIYYKKIGKTVFVSFYIDGTSNNTSTSFTLPYTTQNTTVLFDGFGKGADNGVTIPIMYFSVPVNSATVTCYNGTGLTAWTGSGTKQVIGKFWYEAQ